MVLRMLDSITPANLPSGADAYAGYVDGRFANAGRIAARFPGAHILTIAVFSSSDAEAADCEAGDMTPAEIPGWVKRQQARGVHRPVVYSSVSQMGAVLSALQNAGIPRAQVRIWSAHYGAGKHVCGPATCRLASTGMDGTQWTDHAAGTGNSLVDESVLNDDFFTGGTMSATGPEHWDAADWKVFTAHVWESDIIPVPAYAAAGQPTWWPTRAVRELLNLAHASADPAAVARAVVAALPAGTTGLTQADVEAAVKAVFAQASA